MRLKNLAKIGVLLLFFLFPAPSTGEITSVKLRSDDRHLILFQKFGFTKSGHVSVAISSVSVTSVPVTSNFSRPDPSRLGFFLISQEAQPDFHQEHNLCDLYSKFTSLLFTFQDLSSHSSLTKSHSITFPSEYSLYFANCNPLSYVTMNVVTELYNTDNNGATKNYLSSGLTQLPSLYFIFSLIYLCFLGIWIPVCFKNKSFLQRIHFLMGTLLVLKALSLFCGFKDQYHMKVTGSSTHVWDAMFYAFHVIKAVILYIVMTMIGDGSCSFLKPYLKERNYKKILMVVIPFQDLATVACIVTLKWVTCNMVLLVVECICCFAIIYSTGWSISSETYTTDAAAADIDTDTIEHLKGGKKYLGTLYMVVNGYLLIGWIPWGLAESIVEYKYKWLCIALAEIISLVFYMVMFWMFRPFDQKDEYFVQINLQEVEDVQDKQLEEFELV